MCIKVSLNYQVCGSSQHKQSQTEVKVLLDDQVTQKRGQHDSTHTQEVGDCPRVLVLREIRSETCHSRDKQSSVEMKSYVNRMQVIQVHLPFFLLLVQAWSQTTDTLTTVFSQRTVI